MGNGKRKGSELASSSQKDQTLSSGLSLERGKSIPDLRTDLTNTSSLRKKASERTKPVRRSSRIQNTTSTTQDKDTEPVFEEIDASESENEDQLCADQEKKVPEDGLASRSEKEYQPCADQEKTGPEDGLASRSLEEKIDDLNLLVEAQGKTIEVLKSKEDGGCSLSQTPCFNDIRLEVKMNKYKSMYIDSQKKIEALRDENYQLSKRLEHALGKLEVYEKGLISCEAIEKLKEALLISSLSKITETVLGFPSSMKNVGGLGTPTATAETRAPEPKKKKLANGNRK